MRFKEVKSKKRGKLNFDPKGRGEEKHPQPKKGRKMEKGKISFLIS